jgi:hypothetical protein
MLQNVFLVNNVILYEGAKWIAEAIKVNSTLQEIYLGENICGNQVEFYAPGD